MYQVKQYTDTEWEEKFNAEYESGEMENVEDQINIVWNGKAACMDITANGKRLVPILRKIEKALRGAGLSGDNGEYVFSGWFDSWADALVNPADRKYFVWNYDGKQDRENGHWAYSWGIEQISDDQWYIFLNIATASRVDEYIREKLEEKETGKAVEKMEYETMENLYGCIAKIYFNGPDAEQSDNFPVLWEITYDGKETSERKIHKDMYIPAINHLGRLGYIF